jgi:hypothetical protein
VQVTPADNSSTISHRPEDMQLVLYRPPPNPICANTATAAAIICDSNLAVLQQHAQQPNGVAALWRSLTPGQRRSLAGMWDALRDQKMLAGMLRKLPAQEWPGDAAQAAAAGATELQHNLQHLPACVIEELSEADGGQGQHMAATAAAAVEPSGGLLQQQQQVVQAVCAPAAADDGMVIDAGSAALGAEQQQQQQDECGMDLD